MTISPPRFPHYAGTYELLKSGEDPPTWEGFYKDRAGVRQKVRLHLVKE